MNRETCISGDRTIINTDFYLHLLSCENNNNKLIKYLEHQIFLYEKDIKNLSKDYKAYYSLIQEERYKLETYQDILERVKSGKYE